MDDSGCMNQNDFFFELLGLYCMVTITPAFYCKYYK